ncbi:hypothetical protein BLNAU_3368 [Blattamonas nauphoetae]|uniref:ZP domain-containing protein n=1 Tax=Blattamonas nauphoetae TaxID=2049346 RepID=A0ABQ9YCT0_9EUKA|nr:hypothetical protein BLNAU_3368 [Blattamonas nauphoetae]
MSLFLLFWSILHCVDEHSQDFDAVFDKKLAESNLASSSELIMELNGKKTVLTHRASLEKEHHRKDKDTANGRTRTDPNVERWMMEVLNSSLTMRSFRLDAGMTGAAIFVVHQSSVEVFDCELLSNVECSGFVLADAERSGSNRIVIVEIDYQHQNITDIVIGRTSVTSSSPMTSVQFTLCTFSGMTTGAGINPGGSAIFIFNTESSLNVTQCSFHLCTCAEVHSSGGAISVWEYGHDKQDCPTSISG